MKDRFKTVLVVTTATHQAQTDVADLDDVLMVMADCKADMVASMKAMVMNWNRVSRNGMTVCLDSVDTWVN